MTPPIRVFVVDDQPIIRDGLKYMLQQQDDMEVVGVAGTAGEALAGLSGAHPDVVLLDIRLPDASGLEVAKAVTAWDPAPRVLLLTTFDLDEYVLEALRAGAMGYVLKDLALPDLLATIRAVNRGEAMYRTRAASWALARAFQHPPRLEASEEGVEPLTEREREVLQRMAAGERNSDIARSLFLSEGTVKTHVHSILQKLHAEDRTQAVVWAFRHGWVR